MRTIRADLIQNILKVTEAKVCQTWLGRALYGGIYVSMDGHWMPVDVMMVCDDGTRIFRTQYSGCSFHETFLGIDAIQEFV